MIGLTGLGGATGASGTVGATGLTGAMGATGFAGLPGPSGAVGATGSAGPTGLKGETGAAGIAGPEGEKGVTGNVGPAGFEGEAGIAGVAGSVGPKGETGAEGPSGSVGPPGPEGSSGSPAYAEFYALMPPDNAAPVAAGAPVLFPQNGPIAGGIVRLSSGKFVLPRVGTYSVDFSVSADEPGQLVIALDSGGGMVELPYTVYGRATGTSEIAGNAIISTTATSSTVELRNPAGNTPALTITPLAGGTHPAAASIVIQQLG